MALPAPRPLLALLLLAASLLAEGSGWDDPSCTGDALTVPRGQRAVMSCAMSTPLTHVVIRLRAPGKASRLIFGVDGPGHFSNNSWRLEVLGSKARLVIPDAQPAQAGNYTWLLVGAQGSVRHTSLHVSVLPELPVTEAEPTPPAGPPVHLRTGTAPPDRPMAPQHTRPGVHPLPAGEEPAGPEAQGRPLQAAGISLVVFLCLAGLGTFAWRRSGRSLGLEKLLQMRMFPAPGPSPEAEGEQGRLAPELQP